MEPEAVINLFDSLWSYLQIFNKQPTSSSPDPNPPPQIHHTSPKPRFPSQLTIPTRSKSDHQLLFPNNAVFLDTDTSSPNSVLKPHLQTVLSDKELSLETPQQFKKLPRKGLMISRKKKVLSKSLSELEFEELKGFMDLGFVFSEEDRESGLVEIIPGLQRLGADRRKEEKLRPYLSEAWEALNRRREMERPLMKWRVPAYDGAETLRGHTAAAICCIASRIRPGLVATAAEDGRVCWYDLRCKDMLFSMDVGNGDAVSALCFKPGNEDIIYVSVGNEVKCFDLHMTSSWKQLESYSYNKDEINQIACHPKSSFLAAADDAGDVKIIDVHQRCLYKTLRAGHKSICSSVQFLPWRSWEVITGGLDSKLVMWDFSKGRPNKIMDFGSGGDSGQCCNPAFVHALVVPDLDIVDKVGKVCVVARGDGVVNIINIESELAALKSKMSTKPKLGSKSNPRSRSSAADSQSADQNDRNLCLDFSVGGHVAAVSSVAFSMFGEKGKFIISGGNDKSVKVWNWSKYRDDSGQTSSGNELLSSSISLSRKVNWLCTTPADSENLVVCDTSKVVKVYSVGELPEDVQVIEGGKEVVMGGSVVDEWLLMKNGLMIIVGCEFTPPMIPKMD
ncbi:UNVERIFIED_CONTAM: WD repeat-containing protein 53 [Sesamum calycinum]|uniref:WD repeat-containing protein 53 n=1 Tax=Sesamum calycinum TaxID=2727403 RepID=A0AAW2Q6U8_9LAMI